MSANVTHKFDIYKTCLGLLQISGENPLLLGSQSIRSLSNLLGVFLTKNQFFGFGREKNPNLGKIFNRCRVCRAHAHPLEKLPVRIAVLHSVFPPYQTNEILSLLDEVPIQFEDFTVAAPVDNMQDSYSERLPRAPDPHPAEHHVVLQPRRSARCTCRSERASSEGAPRGHQGRGEREGRVYIEPI